MNSLKKSVWNHKNVANSLLVYYKVFHRLLQFKKSSKKMKKNVGIILKILITKLEDALANMLTRKLSKKISFNIDCFNVLSKWVTIRTEEVLHCK